PFNLTTSTTHLDIDFYRIRSLDFNNPVYVDGVAVGSLTDGGDSVDLAQDPYTISIDGDWGAGDHTLKIESDREWYWWDYDDFSWDEIIITPEVSSFIDHYRIEHPATGITCQASTVTIRACADSDCTTEYADPTTVTLTATATDGTPTWVGGATRTFTGHTEVQLRQTIPATVTLDLTSTGIAPSNPTQCYEDGVLGDCSIEFYESGFLLTVEDGRSCEELNGTIQAVQTDDETNLCVGDDSFAGKTKEVGFWFNYAQPDSGTHSPAIDTTLIDTTPTSVGFSMVFDTQAKATYSLTYNDAGSLNLYARHEGSGDSAGLVMTTIGSTAASFVVAPHHFEVTSPLDNSSTSGTTTGIAAEPFEATITAVCQNGNPTPNFAAQTTLSAKTPSDPDNNLGTFSSGGLSTEDFNEGEANPTDLSYDEVGNFTLKAESTDYLSSGMDINGTTVVGRFIPHHFELSQGSLNNRSELGCAITPSFTYLDENLEFAFNLTAVNAADDITENYFGSFAKFEGETISANYTIGAAGNIPDGSTTKLTTRLDDIIVSRIADWTDGNAGFTVKLNVDRLPQPYGPFTDTRFGIFVRDSDGVEIEPLDLDVDNDSNNDYAQAAENTLLRYGRIRLENAHGSELLPLSMPVYAEYFDGNGFINNADDTCSLFNVSDLTCADVDTDDELTCTNVTVSGIDVGHDEFFTLPAPDNKATGALEYTLGVDSWLQYDWDNEDNDDDPLTGQDNPTARATFGIYKGSESIIYLRETTWR
ncbi:MAG: DUF6701 domain-containing protein, partial [Thermodesulfobacteriota bacterium]|nr:DUF6701 domain-containing protein [Thermodesulfobacteriota bacterium]